MVSRHPCQVKARRDVRPNNGFLMQLVRLQAALDFGTKGDLVMLGSAPGAQLAREAAGQGTSLLPNISGHFGKQTGGTLCGVRTACIVLNCLGLEDRGGPYTEAGFWGSVAASPVAEEVVRRQGMTLAECAAVLRAAGAEVEVWGAEPGGEQHFVQLVGEVAGSGGKRHMVLNYHMGVLGQGEVLGGHISPVGAVAGGRALVMDVWPQTREPWAELGRLWAALDTVDPASGARRGFLVVSRHQV
jgi:glutathione gamma-glutamylcysteinyltransferase